MASEKLAPSDRYCDLVMKGGIASGIVYPLAVVRLAEHFRFRSIGGTSAGAVAAAVTAAAEYRRRSGHPEPMGGFGVLENVPKDLREEVGSDTRRLRYLFQPQPECKRLFHVLRRGLNRMNTATRSMAIALGILEAYWLAVPASVAVGVLGWWLSSSVLAGLSLGLLVLLASLAIWVYFDLTRNVVANGFGMCNGTTVGGEAREAITPWLHGLIQTAAGRTTADSPLTFGDLWSAPGFPPTWAALPPSPASRSIDLSVFTTSLAHVRPFIFPDMHAKLFYRRDELSIYLPPVVMNWIDTHAVPYVPDAAAGDPSTADADAQQLRPLPAPGDLPILFAARMSFSFPLLFSSIPLYAIDYDRADGPPAFKRCWFSDGGIASNFPIHMFDGLLPSWPTFGIQLEDSPPGNDEMVYLPTQYGEGYRDLWDRFDEDEEPEGRFGGFLLSIFGAAQNWNDNTQTRMPGVRDRVARVRLKSNEGGFNLNMEAPLQLEISKRGAEAAAKLLERFGTSQDVAPVTGWNEQRWSRLDVLVRMLEKRLPGVGLALQSPLPHARSYAELVDDARSTAPAGHDQSLSGAQADGLSQILTLFAMVSREIANYTHMYKARPFPEPELRVRPPL